MVDSLYTSYLSIQGLIQEEASTRLGSKRKEPADWDLRRNRLLGTFPDYYRAILISHLSFYDFISGSPCSRSQPTSLYLGRGFSHTTVNKHRFRSNCQVPIDAVVKYDWWLLSIKRTGFHSPSDSLYLEKLMNVYQRTTE